MQKSHTCAYKTAEVGDCIIDFCVSGESPVLSLARFLMHQTLFLLRPYLTYPDRVAESPINLYKKVEKKFLSQILDTLCSHCQKI